MENTKEKGFGSKIGFILATAGSAVGLGNVWRFPYLVGQYGGGAFVLVFLLSVVLIGLSVMIAEKYLGRRTGTTVVGAYGKVSSRMKWIGLLCVFIPFIIATYYALIGGWSTGYATNYLFNPDLIANTISEAGSLNFFGEMTSTTLTPIFYTMLFLGTALIIVCMGVQKGIEKVSKILMPTLLIILLVVVIKSLTLGEGVAEGVKFYIGKFDFKALGFDGAVAAMGQAFYSLSLGMGIIIAYGSYAGKNINIVKSTFAVCTIDTLVALVAGLAIFPAIFALGDGEMAKQAGPSLLFVVLPQIFSHMKGGALFGFLFFALIVFSAITSVISLLEVVTQYTIKKFNLSRTKATLIFGTFMFIISIFVSLSVSKNFSIFGFDIFTYLDEVANNVLLPFAGISACIAVGWIIGPKTVYKEFEEMGLTFKGQKIWMFLLRFVTPVLILIVLIMGIIGKWQEASLAGRNYGFIILGAVLLVLYAIIWNINQNKGFATIGQSFKNGFKSKKAKKSKSKDTNIIENIADTTQEISDSINKEFETNEPDDKQE